LTLTIPAAASSVPYGEDLDEIAFIETTVDISNWELCYDSSVDAYTAAAFHTGCNGKGATVTIAEYDDVTYGSGIKRFGAYSPIDWSSPTEYYNAPSARLFNLLTLEAFSPSSSTSVYVNQSRGPSFGASNDLVLLENSIHADGYCFPSDYSGWSRSDCVTTGSDHKFYSPPSFKVYAVN
jgi:hypothetical protein